MDAEYCGVIKIIFQLVPKYIWTKVSSNWGGGKEGGRHGGQGQRQRDREKEIDREHTDIHRKSLEIAIDR